MNSIAQQALERARAGGAGEALDYGKSTGLIESEKSLPAISHSGGQA